MGFNVGKLRVKKSLNGFSYEGLVSSTAPALGLPEDTLPFFSLSYALGNIYASFSEPLYVFDEILYPPEMCDRAEKAYKLYLEEAEKVKVKVAGGHTGCYDGLDLPLIVTNAVGRQLRQPEKPEINDEVLFIGKPFLESDWLLYLSGEKDERVDWRELTPVPALKKLMKLESVKLLHDVSEGGPWGALMEIQEGLGLGIKLNEAFYEISRGRSPADPSYGSVIALVKKGKSREVCEGFEHCYEIGTIAEKSEGMAGLASSDLVELYGSVVSWDIKLNKLGVFLKKIRKLSCIKNLIPEVGTNVVFAETPGDPVEKIAGVDGRIVRSSEGFRVGRPAYNASRHMALVLKEAMKSEPSIRAAINLALNSALVKVLEQLGYKLQEVRSTDSYCPVLDELKREGVKQMAIIEPPGYGLEGNVVILSRSLNELYDLLKEICKRLEGLF